MRINIFLISLSIVLVLLMWAGFLPVMPIINIHFYLLLWMIVADYFYVRKFNLYQIWIAGFVFVILSEMLILSDSYTVAQVQDYVPSFSYLLLANNLVLLGYWCCRVRKKQEVGSLFFVCHDKLFLSLVLLGLVIYIAGEFSSVYANFTLGRQVRDAKGSSFSIFGIITTSLGYLLPAAIAYYFRYIRKRQLFLSFFLVLPVWIIQLLLATRFHLLFSVIPYFVLIGLMDVRRISWKKNVMVFSVLLVLLVVSSFLKENRNNAFSDWETVEQNDDASKKEFLSVKLAHQMSPEGVVQMTYLANKYFSTHPLSYGRESTFILYFWIPRAIWPEKPTQLDYWLIREFNKRVPDGHSTASGFTGELRADFGMFSLLFVFLGGMLLRRGDVFAERVFCFSNDMNMIFAAILFPYVFFLIRSPLTATMAFLFELLLFRLLRHVVAKRVERLIP